MYITITNQKHGEKHFRRVTLEELVDAIRSGQYEKQISELRQLYSALHAYTDNDGKTQGMDDLTERIPEVCFAAEYDHYQKDVRMKAYNALLPHGGFPQQSIRYATECDDGSGTVSG